MKVKFWSRYFKDEMGSIDIDSSARYIIYTLFCLVSLLVPSIFFQDKQYIPDDNNVMVIKRIYILLCTILCIGAPWRKSLGRYYLIYWYLTLMYTLPFYSAYILIYKYCSKFFVANMALSIFLLALLVNWASFTIITIIGAGAGIILHLIFYQGISELPANRALVGLYTILFSLLIAFFFAKQKEQNYLSNLKNLKLLASSIAHELRTPLLKIAGNARLIENNIAVEETIKAIKLNIAQCNNIIDSILLNISGSFTPQLEKCDLGLIITAAIAEYPLNSAERNLINLDFDQQIICKIDSSLLKQVIFNLLKNSLYFIKTSGKGEIFISLVKKNNMAKIIFKDTGPGISPEYIENIFEAFNSTIRTGTGVGLALSKYIIEKMGGKIYCYSSWKKETRFEIEFSTVEIN